MGKIECNGDCFNCIHDDCLVEKDREKVNAYWRDYRKTHKEQYKKYEHTRYVKNHSDEMCRRRLLPILQMKGKENNNGESLQTKRRGRASRNENEDFASVDC